ncbi:DNA mismatch repair protein MutT, partial [Vibrio parahaemolyticus]|nr:DNA mismatch repair protein MutT [Vibrio parahaemolyticus]
MIPIKATHVSGVVISKIDGIEKMLLLKRVKG